MNGETDGAAWPEPLARRVGALLAILADAGKPDRIAVHEVVHGLTSIPGIREARLATRDEHVDARFATRIAVGPAHVLYLSGPDVRRPKVVQSISLLAEALAMRMRETAGREGPSPEERMAFYRVIGQHAPNVIAVHDKDGTLSWMSRPPMGQATSDDDPTDVANSVPPSDLRWLTELRQRLLDEAGDEGEVDLRMAGPDGDWRNVHVVVRNLTDNPAVNGLVSYATDVTDLRQIQASERVGAARLRTLIESIDVAILVVDENMRVAEVNPKALALMRVDVPAGDVIGRDMAALLKLAEEGQASREVLRIAAEFADRSISGGVPVLGEEINLPDGTVIESDYLPIEINGRIRGHFLVGREVTDRVAAQQNLEARNRELAELAMLKDEFLATVSHELRTPLTAASSLLELLGDADTSAGPPDREVVEALRRNTSRLLAIVEDLLLLARVEANQVPLDIRLVRTAELLDRPLAALRADAAEHGVSLAAQPSQAPPAHVLGDPHWLDYMVRHIVSGALTPGSAGAQVTLHEEVSDGEWTLSVSGDTLRTAAYRPDTGPASGADDRIGIGLGLTLARAIARRHGGDLRIEPDGRGAVVRISLKVADPNDPFGATRSSTVD